MDRRTNLAIVFFVIAAATAACSSAQPPAREAGSPAVVPAASADNLVYPRNEQLRPAREIVVVEDAIFGAPDAKGFIPGTDPAKTLKNDQTFSMFNGRLDNGAVSVNPGDLVRVYFVNVGPGVSAAHAIGTVLDRVYDGKMPIFNVQTYPVPAGSGAMFEFYIPEAGVFPFVDHDKLAFLQFGLALAFATPGVPAAAH